MQGRVRSERSCEDRLLSTVTASNGQACVLPKRTTPNTLPPRQCSLHLETSFLHGTKCLQQEGRNTTGPSLTGCGLSNRSDAEELLHEGLPVQLHIQRSLFCRLILYTEKKSISSFQRRSRYTCCAQSARSSKTFAKDMLPAGDTYTQRLF